MLCGEDLRELIQNGSLGIEPFLSEAIGPCSIDLRLGLQFAIPTEQEPLIEHLELGQPVTLPPGETCIFTTLESIFLSTQLVGWIHGSAAHARLGLFLQNSRVDPGFAGKLALSLHNLSRRPVSLVSGLRIASIAFDRLSARPRTSSYEAFSPVSLLDYMLDQGMVQPAKHLEGTSPSRVFRMSTEYRGLINEVQGIDTRTSFGTSGDPKELQTLLRVASDPDTTAAQKGRSLEDLVEKLLRFVSGLRIISRDARLAAEEIDFLVENCVDSLFWRNLGTPIVVECKNWSSPVGASEITNLIGKMEALGPTVKFAFLVAINGITGDAYKDAQLRRREGRQKGRNVILFTGDDLQNLARGFSFHHVLERKHDELLLI